MFHNEIFLLNEKEAAQETNPLRSFVMIPVMTPKRETEMITRIKLLFLFWPVRLFGLNNRSCLVDSGILIHRFYDFYFLV